MSAINAALDQIDRVAEEGDLTAARHAGGPLELETLAEPILLPDGKRIYPPRLHGQPIDELACALLDMENPAESTFLRLTGPPGSGKSQIARAVALPAVASARPRGADQARRPVLRVRRARRRALERRVPVPPRVRARRRRRRHRAARRLGVRAGDARRVGGDDRRGQHDPRRRAAVDQRVPRRPPEPVPARDRPDRDRHARVRVPARLQPRAARRRTDIPDAWHSRFPATLEVTSNWPALVELGAPRRLVGEAAALDRQRIAGEDGLCWTPQFRDIEALSRMIDRVGERAALAFFVSNLLEQVQAGKLQDAEAAAVCRMLDQAGYAHLKVSATGRVPSLHGYPRAVTS